MKAKKVNGIVCTPKTFKPTKVTIRVEKTGDFITASLAYDKGGVLLQVPYSEIRKVLANVVANELKDYFTRLGEIIRDTIEKLGKILSNIAEKYELYKKSKFKPIKSLIKPYKEPFIKVRYRARDNL